MTLIMTWGAFSVKAAVPVVVFGEYLEEIWDVDDADDWFDLQAKIQGNLEYTTGSPYDATVTHTEKIQGTSTDKTDLLDEIITNIDNRIIEIKGEIDDTDSQDEINKLNDGKDELEELKTQTEDLKEELAETIALDVHIVKDTTDAIEDLKNIAKERLARKQVGEMVEKLTTQYEQRIIEPEYFFNQEPFNVASAWLDSYFDVDETKSSLPKDELDNINTAVKGDLASSYVNAPKPEKDNDFVGIDNVFNEDEGGGWDQWLLALQDNHNPYGIFLTAYDSSQEVAANEQEKNLAQYVAGQGVAPIYHDSTSESPISCTQPTEQCPRCEGGVCLNPDGTEVYPVRETGGVIAAAKSASTQSLLDRANNPFHAPAKDAIGSIEEALESAVKDLTAIGEELQNRKTWDKIAKNSINMVLDIFCACFPDFCKSWEIFNIWDLFPDFEIPDEIEICGRTFHLCDLYPEMCSSIENWPEDQLKDFCSQNPSLCEYEIPGLDDYLRDTYPDIFD